MTEQPVVFSREAEQEVLSAILVNPKCFPKVQAIVEPADFWIERHQAYMAAFASLASQGLPIDLVMVREELRRMGKWERTGGSRSLGELLDRQGSSANVESYAGIVASKALQRRMSDEALRLSTDIVSGTTETAASRVAKLSELVAHTRGKRDTWGQTVAATVDRILDTTTSANTLRLGIPPVDAHIGGIGGDFGAWFNVIYGPPEGAKTATALGNIIRANTGEDGRKGAIFSLEMSGMELAIRALAGDSNVPSRGMRNRDLTPGQIPDLLGGADIVSRWPLTVIDEMMTADQIYAQCAALKQEGVEYVVIDNLSEVINGYDTDIANEAHTVRTCVNIKKTLGMTVFLLAHTTVEGNRTGQAHKASHVRGTGRTIGSADLALTILRGKRDRNHVGIHIGKGRHTAPHTWHAEDDGAERACGFRFDPVRLRVVCP